MKQGSPYSFKSNRVKEILELKNIKEGIKSPFRQSGGQRINMREGQTIRTRISSQMPAYEDDSCFITHTNDVYPNMFLRPRDHVPKIYHKRAKTLERSRGRLWLIRSFL
jgi:hypothetical protein